MANTRGLRLDRSKNKRRWRSGAPAQALSRLSWRLDFAWRLDSGASAKGPQRLVGIFSCGDHQLHPSKHRLRQPLRFDRDQQQAALIVRHTGLLKVIGIEHMMRF